MAYASKNMEQTVISNLIERVKLINGTTNYNFSLKRENIFEDLKGATEINNYPSVCFGALRLEQSEMPTRDMFSVPVTVELWGYVKNPKNPLQDAAKLLSDLRIAIGSEQTLSDKIAEYTFLADMGAIGDIGFIRFELQGKFEFSLIQ
jgi:hypothetical protein